MSNTVASDKNDKKKAAFSRKTAAKIKNAAKNSVYLDHAATTPIDGEVLRAMLPYFGIEYGNASSMHTSGRMAAEAIKKARSIVAGVLGGSVLPEEIIFTGSGTESDNLAVVGTARANRKYGNHIIISAVEHKAVIEAAKRLEKDGFEVSIAPVDKFGVVKKDELLKLVTHKTILVSIMYANNEIGTVQPIKDLFAAIRSKISKAHAGGSGHYGANYSSEAFGRGLPIFHTDACQAAGALSLDVKALGADMMTLNGSKIYGPKGIGILYKRKTVAIEPLIVGGEQEFGLRAGTENVAMAVGLAEALAKADAMRISESRRLIFLRDRFIKKLFIKIRGMVLNGHPTIRLANNVHISIPEVEGESILLMLDEAGIEVSTGSACSAYDLKPSHVLMAIGQSAELAHGSIRFSFGRDTTQKELDYTLSVFPSIIERLKGISAAALSTNTKINVEIGGRRSTKKKNGKK